MQHFGIKNPHVDLVDLGLANTTTYWNLAPSELIQKTIQTKEGQLTDTGALVIKTGKFTGRSPKDRFIVKDDFTAKQVDWGDINQAIAPENFDVLEKEVIQFLDQLPTVYVQDAYACTDAEHRLNIRVYAEKPWQALFVNNMFLNPESSELKEISPDWQIFVASSYEATPAVHGTRQANFTIVNFTKRKVIIGGSAYTGEIKKSIFAVLNFLLPLERKILPMHCSANVGQDGDTALFFGLSGTGKTTLSTDENRQLIGDDEHAWSAEGVFNFEGGCYAKTINLSAADEPQIYNAIKFGAMLENVGFQDERQTIVDYEDASITQNTRVSYPIGHIDNIVSQPRSATPKHIFFLTCDAFGVLPPIARLNKEQAMYHFLSGYTAKVAGTEAGIDEPEATFSACFGLPFLPLHPTAYMNLLGRKLEADPSINVWLVNTGWTGGAYGTGKRMKLSYTRAMIQAALNGELDNTIFKQETFFDLSIPTVCPNVPSELLDPSKTWADAAAYQQQAAHLKTLFQQNFAPFESHTNIAVLRTRKKKKAA
ncbi:MAG: phosphoenolpyruvate carboxykinase (ATP) [Bacteroidota bacterium]